MHWAPSVRSHDGNFFFLPPRTPPGVCWNLFGWCLIPIYTKYAGIILWVKSKSGVTTALSLNNWCVKVEPVRAPPLVFRTPPLGAASGLLGKTSTSTPSQHEWLWKIAPSMYTFICLVVCVWNIPTGAYRKGHFKVLLTGRRTQTCPSVGK